MPPAMPPTITPTSIAKLVTAVDAGNLQRFNLSNGQAMTGWILEISDSHVLIYSENHKQKAQQHSLAIAELTRKLLPTLTHTAKLGGWLSKHSAVYLPQRQLSLNRPAR